jgi:hypothetical protein
VRDLPQRRPLNGYYIPYIPSQENFLLVRSEHRQAELGSVRVWKDDYAQVVLRNLGQHEAQKRLSKRRREELAVVDGMEQVEPAHKVSIVVVSFEICLAPKGRSIGPAL